MLRPPSIVRSSWSTSTSSPSAAEGVEPTTLAGSGVYTFSRAVMFTLMNVYAVRMAGVLLISLGSLWLRTRAMPRLAVFLTFGLAVLMLVSISSSLWLILVFPAWVFGISVYILIETGRGKPSEAEEILGGVPRRRLHRSRAMEGG